MQRQRQIRAEAAQQMERLQQFRAEQAAVRRVAQANLESYREFKIPWNASDGSETPASSIHDAKIVASHERLWSEIDSALTDAQDQGNAMILSSEDIPWPPFEDNLRKYLLEIARFSRSVNLSQGSDGSTGPPLKRAYTQACLRWHPDKFQHKYSRYVISKDWDKILHRVQEISQGLNQAWAELQTENNGH